MVLEVELGGVDLDRGCADHRIVGAAIGLSVAGERSVAVHGIANARTGAAVERDTAFLAGSVTKAMTASLVAMSVAEGAIDLDTPVRDVVAEFSVADERATRQITVRHLLTHTAGFDGDIWIDNGEGDTAISRLTAALHDAAQMTPPGSRFSYNNAAYTVLGRLVEVLRGCTFEEAIQDRIAQPCAAGITTDVRAILGRRYAIGHAPPPTACAGGSTDPAAAPDSFEPVDCVVGPACLAPAGSRTWATVDDLLSFGEMHLGRHGGPGTSAALVAMRTPHVAVHDPNNGGTMALGMFLDDRWGTPVVFHDGGVNGQAAYLRILPDDDAVLVVMSTGGVPQTFHRAVFTSMAESLGRAVPPAGVPDPHVRIDPARYVGGYRSSSTVVEVREHDGALDATIVWGADTAAPRTLLRRPLVAIDEQAFITPVDGRDYVIVFPPATEPCDHLLAGLRLLTRVA